MKLKIKNISKIFRLSLFVFGVLFFILSKVGDGWSALGHFVIALLLFAGSLLTYIISDIAWSEL